MTHSTEIARHKPLVVDGRYAGCTGCEWTPPRIRHSKRNTWDPWGEHIKSVFLRPAARVIPPGGSDA